MINRLSIAALLALAALALLAPGALAAPPQRFAQIPEDGKPGEAAGQFNVVQGIAAETGLPGHVFVVDQRNARIDELTPWGEFVKAWGWNVIKGSVGQGLQSCTAQTGCQAGSTGGGAGQLNVPEGIAVDGEGDVYVIELANHRVQKFDPDGGPDGGAKFLLTFGYKVNKTHEGGGEAEANLCTAASGDECQAGSPGTGAGLIGGDDYRKKLVASSVDNAVFVGEVKSIQKFTLGGTFTGETIPLPTFTEGLAVDSTGNLYVGQGEAVRKLKPHGPSAEFLEPEFKPEHAGESVKAIALDGDDNLYVAEQALGGEPDRVQKYDASGKCLTCGADGEREEFEEKGKKVVRQGGFDRDTESQLETIAATSACKSDDAYVLHFKPSPERDFFRAFGETPDPSECEPPRKPPTIDAQYASSVETGEATLRAQINPHFWSGTLGTTTYRVQYATEACFEGGGWGAGCVEETPEVVLPGGAVGADILVAVRLEGLVPGTAYRYRFAAEGTGVAGEVLGVGGEPGVPGKDTAFVTFREAVATPPCPANEAFRGGASARLPDCRAYEMVTPLDKEGGDIAVLEEAQTQLPSVLSVSAASGDRFAYGSARSFGGAASAPLTTQYIAARYPGEGWVTHPISPPRGRNVFENVALNYDTEFRFFSDDLCSAWLQSYAELPGAQPPAPAGVVDLFRRSDEECGGPSFEALNLVTPPVASGDQFRVELQGVSADGATTVFQADDELAPGGSPAIISSAGDNSGPRQLYAARGGEVRFLCVLPEGAGPWTGPCTAGGGGKGGSGEGTSREGNVTGALSSDGTKIYWTNTRGAPGKIYLRENPFGEGPECSEEGSPCSLAVSQGAEAQAGNKAGSAQFWAAASDGSKAIFTVASLAKGERLYEYRAADRLTQPIASEVLGLMGQSEDASRIYFASQEALTLPGEENENGEHAEAGNANLYFYEAGEPGSFRFIGALDADDLSQLSPIALQPRSRTARVAADGRSAAFMSSAPLSGYDNTDVVSGKADAEVFIYEASADEGKGGLHCASCDPSGARPQGVLAKEGQLTIQAAAKISVPQNMLYPGRFLAEDGKRLFFESYDPLTPRDTNGQKDVYQWEAPDSGSCKESSSTFSPQNGGCIDLISSGQSVRESSFVDASPSGKDVFIATVSSFLPQDPGLVDVYDAREGGGLPPPPGLPSACEGEACQAPSEAPNDPTPASASFKGAGDLVKKSNRKKAHKHKHKRQHRKTRRHGRKGR